MRTDIDVDKLTNLTATLGLTAREVRALHEAIGLVKADSLRPEYSLPEVQEAEDAMMDLRPWVQHKSTCIVNMTVSNGLNLVIPKCTCGLDAALAAQPVHPQQEDEQEATRVDDSQYAAPLATAGSNEAFHEDSEGARSGESGILAVRGGSGEAGEARRESVHDIISELQQRGNLSLADRLAGAHTFSLLDTTFKAFTSGDKMTDRRLAVLHEMDAYVLDENRCGSDEDEYEHLSATLLPRWADMLRGVKAPHTAVAPVETREEKKDEWTCGARASTDPPQECNWPMCGCDPYADKVIAALQECNLLNPPAPLPEALEAGAQTVIDDLFARGMEASDLAVALQRHLNAAEDALEAVEQEIERALDSLDKNCFGVDMREKHQSMNPVIDTVVRQSDVLHDLLTIRKVVKAIREQKHDQARGDGISPRTGRSGSTASTD